MPFPFKFETLKAFSSFRDLSGSLQRKINARTIRLCASILFPVMVLLIAPLVMQYVHLNGEHPFLWWYRHFKGPYYCNVLTISFLFMFCYLVINSTYFATLCLTGFCTLFTIIDQQKMHILNQPFLPCDLLFIRQAFTIARLYALPIAGILLLPVPVLVLLLHSGKKMVHFRLAVPLRLSVITIYLLATFLIAGNLPKVLDTLNSSQSIYNEYWNQIGNYNKNGILYSFVMNLVSMHIQKPAFYNRRNMESLFDPYKNDSGPVTSVSDVHPDVIVVLSESFWDITKAENLSLSADPIPFFHSLCRSSLSTKLISPTFGGNTCAAEFEILTGMPHSFFPSGSTAYNQFIKRPIPSLVQVFKENGYRTTGIHPFSRWFWNRTNVYRYLGFDAFITRETMNNPEIKGKFISDREFAKQIIAAASPDDRPDFIFALSMQNHGPYQVDRYKILDHRYAPGLSAEATSEINTYAQGLTDADNSLRILAHYIDTVKTPTLLFFFGDHLPGFSDLYRESGLDTCLASDTIWAHTTPSVWYSNYPLTRLPDSIISMCYMPLYVTIESGVITPVYYRLLDAARREHPVSIVTMNQKDKRMSSGEFSSGEAVNMCLYDALFGRQYADRFHHIERPGD